MTEHIEFVVKIARLEEERASLAQDLAAMDARRQVAEAQLLALLGSTSWRVTRAIRAPIRLLRGEPAAIVELRRRVERIIRRAGIARLFGQKRTGVGDRYATSSPNVNQSDKISGIDADDSNSPHFPLTLLTTPPKETSTVADCPSDNDASAAHMPNLYLPAIDISSGWVSGRVPRDGYQRSWGLAFSDLAERIRAEPLWREAVAQQGLASIVGEQRRMNLYLLMTRFLPRLADRNIVEFGAYKGGNAIFLALVMREIDPTARIYALDTFDGMPPTDGRIDAHRAGDFADVSLDALHRRIGELRLSNLVPLQGLFQDTFRHLPAGLVFGLAHIDCDIYTSVRYAQEAVWPCMTEGGYVIYDDATAPMCLGATQAVEELIMERKLHSEQIWPHFVFRVRHGRGTR